LLYKNIEIYNVEELDRYADGSVTWCRVPRFVYDTLEMGESARRMAMHATGVELRFVLQSEEAVLRMNSSDGEGVFHVYRGSIQGGWQDHEVQKIVGSEPQDFVIKRSANPERLKAIDKKCGHPFSSEVIRVIFDRGHFRLYDVQGDVRPPTPEECPKSTLFFYGSSITHGSNSIDMSHSWPSVVGYNLKMDVRNLGMAGSCALEPAFAEYIASEGQKGNWDAAVLEVGINVLSWDDEKIRQRLSNLLQKVAGRNPDKKVFLISPFYHCGDDFSAEKNAARWRTLAEQTAKALNFDNVTYINGMDIIGNASFMSADEVHPNIYGVQQIADRLTGIIASALKIPQRSEKKARAKPKSRPLWIAAAALAVALAILLGSFAFGGTKTLYLPETVEYFVNGELYSTYMYHYDDNGFLQEIVTREKSGEETRAKVTCDKNGNVTQVVQTQEFSGSVQGTLFLELKDVYTYTAQGNLLSYRSYRGAEQLKKCSWEYDRANRPIKRIQESDNGMYGKTVLSTEYEYDKKGNLIVARTFNNNLLATVNEFTYDEDGRRISEEISNGQGSRQSRAEYTYEDGKTVIRVGNSFTGNANNTIYTYDHAGNLICKDRTDGTGTSYYYQYAYTYREVEVSQSSPRQSYSITDSLPKTGYFG